MTDIQTSYIHQEAQAKLFRVLPREVIFYAFLIENGNMAELHADNALTASLILIELGHTPVKVLNPKEHD